MRATRASVFQPEGKYLCTDGGGLRTEGDMVALAPIYGRIGGRYIPEPPKDHECSCSMRGGLLWADRRHEAFEIAFATTLIVVGLLSIAICPSRLPRGAH